MSKRFAVLCACLLMMAAWLGLHGGALAQGETLSVRRADGVGDAVFMWEKSDGQKYLLLPAYMHEQTLCVEYDGISGVYLGDRKLENGAETNAVSDGAKLILKDGRRSENLLVMTSRNLPAVHIATQSGQLDYIHKKKGNKEAGELLIVTEQGETAYSGALDSIKGHGNATFVYDKKSYQIKLEDKAEILGMDEGKTYVLLANQHENSLMRNRLTFDLARAMGLAYSPECRSVDLYMNGEYRGSYLLCDKVSIASGSVDISDGEDAIEFANEAYIEHGGKGEAYGANAYKKGTYKGVEWPREPQDVTGGYLFELEYADRYPDETSGVVTPMGQAIVVKSPEEMTGAQGKYVYALLSSFERAIHAADGVDQETGRHYTQIADMNSLVRKYMIEEISKNYDGNKSSQYFYKDSDAVDPLIYAGPVWDYDSAWGNYAREGKLSDAKPQGLDIAEDGYAYSFWPALAKQADFSKEVKRVYAQELRPLLEAVTGRNDMEGVSSLDDYARELEASAEMNFNRWRVLNHKTRAVKTGASFEENVEYLRAWIIQRMEYLDTHW